MSTAASLGRIADDPTGQRWEGVYVHHDGHPGTLGARLLAQIPRDHASPAAARAYFLDEHRHGFSSIGVALADNDCYCHRATPDLEFDTYEQPETCQQHIVLIHDEGLEFRHMDMPLGPGVLIPWDEPDPDWPRIERAVKARAERRAAAPRS